MEPPQAQTTEQNSLLPSFASVWPPPGGWATCYSYTPAPGLWVDSPLWPDPWIQGGPFPLSAQPPGKKVKETSWTLSFNPSACPRTCSKRQAGGGGSTAQCLCRIWLSSVSARWRLGENAELAGLAPVWPFDDSQEQVDSRYASLVPCKGSAKS